MGSQHRCWHGQREGAGTAEGTESTEGFISSLLWEIPWELCLEQGQEGRSHEPPRCVSPLSPALSPALCRRFSALHHAALGGSLDLISLLLEAQATVDIKDSNGKGSPPAAPCVSGSRPSPRSEPGGLSPALPC